MSSILDSLKKLEKETAQQEQLPTYAGMDSKAVAPKRALYFIGVTGLLVLAVGLTVYIQGRPRHRAESPAADIALATKSAPALDQPAKPLAPSQAAPDPMPPPLQEDITVAAAAPKVKSSGDMSTASPMPSEDNDAPQQVIQESQEQSTALQEAPREEPANDRAVLEAEPLASATEEGIGTTPEDVPLKAPAPIDRLEGVGFKIQAISWSEVPEQRLAVINSQVIREGDGIEGYQIQRINPDDIVLQRGGKAFRLDFRSSGLP